MPGSYSADLRERVLRACESGVRPATVAKRFQVGLSTVYLWRQQAREDGRRCAKPHTGGPAPLIDAAGEAVLRTLVAERNDCTLDEYAEQYEARAKQKVSRPVLCRALRRLGLPRKNVWPAPFASGFDEMPRSVCVNVSGLGATTPAKMESRALWSS